MASYPPCCEALSAPVGRWHYPCLHAGCFIERFWSLLTARLPLGGIPQLTPALQLVVWQALLARPHDVQCYVTDDAANG